MTERQDPRMIGSRYPVGWIPRITINQDAYQPRYIQKHALRLRLRLYCSPNSVHNLAGWEMKIPLVC